MTKGSKKNEINLMPVICPRNNIEKKRLINW